MPEVGSCHKKQRRQRPRTCRRYRFCGPQGHLMRTLSHRKESASTALLVGLLLSLRRRPRRLLSRRGRRRTGALLMPLVELLLLLLLLLRRALLHRRHLPYQRMRFLWTGALLLLRLTEVTVCS